MLLERCPQCKAYTLLDHCESCKCLTVSAHPAKFSPHDQFSNERIITYMSNPGSHPILSPK